MKKTIIGAAAALAGATMISSAASAMECGDVTMAEWNWASGELMANVDAFILEAGYGCNVELIVGGTTQIFAAMDEKGSPEIAGELWANAVQTPLQKGIDEGRLHSVNAGPITGLGEGWWVTPAFADAHPDLDTVEKIIERPDLFPSADDASRGAFLGCPAGWGCQISNANLYRAFDMEAKGWDLIDPGSAAGLDGAFTKAAERGEFAFGYYWNPTALVGKLGLVAIPWEAEFAGNENWDNCIMVADEGCANPQKTAYVKSVVNTVVTDSFMKKSSVAADYLGARVFPGDVMNAMLIYMAEEQATGADAAIEFLKTQGDVWKAWVPADVAAKVEAAL